MQRYALAAAILAACTGGACATDLIHPAPEDVSVPAWHHVDWTGFYVGGHAGFGSSTSDLFVTAVSVTGVQEGKGQFGGAQLGYDHQFGNVVIGIQTDFAWSDVKVPEAGGGEADWLRWFGTTTLKLGYAVDQGLIYGKAGVSYGRASGYNGPLDDEVTQTHVGWTVGAGAEYALTERFSVFAEYTYLDLGQENYVFPTFPFLVEVDMTVETIKGGVNVRF